MSLSRPVDQLIVIFAFTQETYELFVVFDVAQPFFYRCGKLNLDTPGTPRRDCRLLLIRWASTREEIQQHVKAKTGTATYDRNILLLCVMCVSIIAEISV
ncbi:unnamed protein product [Macrosiphum euphorbiae]|uniref:Uncharacterized protein n=1 Tax=Macrosiphum euphorbiae TaxID=13131 RepID=A0AAV0XL24_9HEMI|nr:unnamed protein product [Macrosiphum euphorbiae]